MFPHVSGKMKIQLNRELVRNFLSNCGMIVVLW